MELGIIIQARMGSDRLPGKTLNKIDSNLTILDYVINQIKHSKYSKKIIVATTSNSEDDKIVSELKDSSVDVFRGSSDDVLDRYYQCAKHFSLDYIVRITADNPLIDPKIFDLVVEKFFEEKPDYASNALVRTFPYGTEIEILSFETLEKIWKNAERTSEREHVTVYIKHNPKQFKILTVVNDENLSHLRWSVDRENDLELVRLIIQKIKTRPILLHDILELFKKEPKLQRINMDSIPDEGYLKSIKNEKSNES